MLKINQHPRHVFRTRGLKPKARKLNHARNMYRWQRDLVMPGNHFSIYENSRIEYQNATVAASTFAATAEAFPESIKAFNTPYNVDTRT